MKLQRVSSNETWAIFPTICITVDRSIIGHYEVALMWLNTLIAFQWGHCKSEK